MEGALDGKADGARATVADVAAGLLERVARAGEDGFVGRVLVRDGHVSGASDLDGQLRAAEDREHAPSPALGRLLHEVAAANGKAQTVCVVHGARGGQRSELAQRVAGCGRRLRPAQALPAREGRAVDRGLGEAGAVGYALEGVFADEPDHLLEEVGARRGDFLAHAVFVAALPGEEQGRVVALGHLPILVR